MSDSEFVKHFNYSSIQSELNKFSEWLLIFETSERFQKTKDKYLEITKRLLNEHDYETRKYLLLEIDQLLK